MIPAFQVNPGFLASITVAFEWLLNRSSLLEYVKVSAWLYQGLVSVRTSSFHVQQEQTRAPFFEELATLLNKVGNVAYPAIDRLVRGKRKALKGEEVNLPAVGTGAGARSSGDEASEPLSHEAKSHAALTDASHEDDRLSPHGNELMEYEAAAAEEDLDAIEEQHIAGLSPTAKPVNPPHEGDSTGSPKQKFRLPPTDNEPAAAASVSTATVESESGSEQFAFEEGGDEQDSFDGEEPRAEVVTHADVLAMAGTIRLWEDNELRNLAVESTLLSLRKERLNDLGAKFELQMQQLLLPPSVAATLDLTSSEASNVKMLSQQAITPTEVRAARILAFGSSLAEPVFPEDYADAENVPDDPLSETKDGDAAAKEENADQDAEDQKLPPWQSAIEALLEEEENTAGPAPHLPVPVKHESKLYWHSQARVFSTSRSPPSLSSASDDVEGCVVSVYYRPWVARLTSCCCSFGITQRCVICRSLVSGGGDNIICSNCGSNPITGVAPGDSDLDEALPAEFFDGE